MLLEIALQRLAQADRTLVPMFPKAASDAVRVAMLPEDVRGLSPTDLAIPVVKLHGSPVLRYCSKCSGLDRFHLIRAIVEGDVRYPRHRDVSLRSHTIVTGTRVDTADAGAVDYLQEQCDRTATILAIGYSGRDPYLLNQVLAPNRDKLWVVLPSELSSGAPLWELAGASHRIDGTASSFVRQWCLASRGLPSWARSTSKSLQLQQVLALGITLEESSAVMEQYFPALAESCVQSPGLPSQWS